MNDGHQGDDNIVKLPRLPEMVDRKPKECGNCDVIRMLHSEINRALVAVQAMFTHKLNNAQIATLGRIDLLQREVKILTDSIPGHIERAAIKGGKAAVDNIDLQQLKEMVKGHMEKKETKRAIKTKVVIWLIEKGLSAAFFVAVLGIASLFLKIKTGFQ